MGGIIKMSSLYSSYCLNMKNRILQSLQKQNQLFDQYSSLDPPEHFPYSSKEGIEFYTAKLENEKLAIQYYKECKMYENFSFLHNSLSK